MNYLLIVILLFCNYVCYSSEINNQNDYVLEIEFWPSFENSSILSIERTANNIIFELKEITHKDNYKTLPKEKDIKLYTKKDKSELLLPKERQKYISKNFVYVKTIEKVTIEPKSDNYQRFMTLNLIKQKSLLLPKNIATTDGIELYFNFIKNENKNYFKFSYLQQSDKEEYDLLKMIFKACLQNFKTEKAKKCISIISGYERIGLQYVIENYSPITYLIYGSFYYDDSIDDFLKEIKKHKKVFLNLEKFNFSRILADTFEDYEDGNEELPNSFWLINEFHLKQIKKYSIELNTAKFFTSKKKFDKEKNRS